MMHHALNTHYLPTYMDMVEVESEVCNREIRARVVKPVMDGLIPNG